MRLSIYSSLLYVLISATAICTPIVSQYLVVLNEDTLDNGNLTNEARSIIYDFHQKSCTMESCESSPRCQQNSSSFVKSSVDSMFLLFDRPVLKLDLTDDEAKAINEENRLVEMVVPNTKIQLSLEDGGVTIKQITKPTQERTLQQSMKPLNSQVTTISFFLRLLDESTHTLLEQRDSPWNLVRISNFEDTVTMIYTYPSPSQTIVTVYVIDTGVDSTHPDFEGRVIESHNFTDNILNEDFIGHGTHCCGIILSNRWGVAKGSANIISLKVLDMFGEGTVEMYVRSVLFMIDHHKKAGYGHKAVASISLGYGNNQLVQMMTEKAVNAGIVVCAASGNESRDAINQSPANSNGVITVAATDIDNKFSDYSNYGKHVIINAPGTAIRSTYPTFIDLNDKSILQNPNHGEPSKILTGTSMACPHVAGAVALYLANGYSHKNVTEQLLSDSIKEKISDVPNETVNNFLSIERINSSIRNKN